MKAADIEKLVFGGGPELVEVLDQAYSTLRHELVNSINSLKITLQVLAAQFEAFDREKRNDYISRSLLQVARQQKLIENLRTYASSSPENSPVPLLVFWSDFLIPVSEKLAHKGIGFTQDCAAGPCVISADKTALSEVLDHLVENAIDALAGVKEPGIWMTAEKIKNNIKISVRDNGHGILNEHIGKVFIPLFSTKKDRSGLGLAIARRAVVKMGGRIALKSAVERGTTVEVWLNTLDTN